MWVQGVLPDQLLESVFSGCYEVHVVVWVFLSMLLNLPLGPCPCAASPRPPTHTPPASTSTLHPPQPVSCLGTFTFSLLLTSYSDVCV
jgi:hypothetical protein